MDENYLDNLLNEISLDKEIDNIIEDELDSQMEEEKLQRLEENAISRQAAFDLGLEQDASQTAEEKDLHFSEAQINELDQLDDLADLDIGDSEFSDIDFNDLDVMKLDDVENGNFDEILKGFDGNFEVNNLFQENEGTGEVYGSAESEDLGGFAGGQISTDQDTYGEQADLNADAFDTDNFLDSLLEETDSAGAEEQPVTDWSNRDSSGMNGDAAADLQDSSFSGDYQGSSESDAEDLDDLLSMLDLEEKDNVVDTPTSNGDSMEPDISLLADLDDIQELGQEPVNKKKTFMQILFGDPDEDDILSEEELAQIEAKKAAKKAKKDAAKEARKEKSDAAKEQKSIKNEQKRKAGEEKKQLKAEKKAKLKAEELANAEPEKKLNTPMVVFIFSVFLGGTFFFYMASNNFNYTQAVENATTYFAKQKYRSAYKEIAGVEVKDKDKELKDRIYTVMYVERLYESYENNLELGRQERALDALLRGVDKYYEHYEEAGQLGITSDLDYSFAQIQKALLENYGITVEQALEINQTEDYEYVQRISSYITEGTAE